MVDQDYRRIAIGGMLRVDNRDGDPLVRT